jgi:DNA-directed RNA polymerase subunit M/transcription elongation factor TFIIS
MDLSGDPVVGARFQAYRSIVDLLGPKLATYLEALAFYSACKSGSIHGIPIWSYSNGATLFETDRPEAHIRELLSSYLDNISRVQHIAPMGHSLAELVHLFVNDTSASAKSAYAVWHDKYLDDIGRSKAVLEAKSEEPEHAFIKCRACKSSAVDTEQKQTRSADEPMTIFCLCRKCGTRFTMS